ncbi:protocadherin Fat 4-like [Patella vulgata]|uniref:protocadherin Fat 4-like n=1 Tax=Patella vulgata TaxID=6465 RepID=UPI0024A7C199|nr:protocadherin Fat 4-like [Patella vulgata]
MTVIPDLKIGSVLGKVEAKDADDSEPSNQIIYILQYGGIDKINLNSKTGEIILKKSFVDDPLQSEFNLVIEARDMGYPARTSSTTVQIEVPLNQPPVVPESVYFTLEENVALGSRVQSLGVTDPDSTDYLEFKLLDKTVPFMLDDQVLRTVDVINAERNSQYSFKVLIIDEGIPSFTVTTLVNINVTDVNDNIPLFKSTHYMGNIKEHGLNNKVKINPPIVIEDADISSRPEDLRYVLVGEHDDMFRINPLTAEIQSVTPEDLDCEKKCLYNLKIKVADEKGIGLSSTVPLTITIEDVNDQAPTFDFIYSVHLNISTLPGWQVVTLRATDKDFIYPNNHIIYLLEDGFGKFSIDSKTGEIWLTHSLMDGEVQDKYELKVSAIDSGIPTQTGITTVTVNVIRNHPPSVNPVYNFLVKEDHPVRSFVGVIEAKDPEGLDNIQFRINETEMPFYIGPESGELFSTAALDREKDAMFTFNVYVIDSGVPAYTVTSAITVYIEDVNDNPPTFKDGDYTVYLPENEVIQELKFKPNVSDNDATPINQQIKFFLEDPSQLFHVDELTGQIETKYPMTFDCEKQHTYNITLIAQDGGGLKSSKQVNIHIMDKNDVRPITRKEFNFTVHPSRPRGAVVGRVTAEDLDYTEENQQLTYILKNGGLGKFTVDDGSGIITLSDSMLAHPYKDAYQLLIEIKDSGKPRLSTETLVNIIVPVDSSPRVPAVIHIQIEENVVPPIVVGKISNKEPISKDGSVKPLHFLMSNTTAPFVIDEKSGDITLVRRLDSETIDQYTFAVDVVKYGYPNYTVTSQIIVEVVDVNDNYPVFSSPSGYIGHIDEDLLSRPPSTKVKLNEGIFVSDDDATLDNREIRLRLIGSVLFDVDDMKTGVTVIKPGFLDAEDASVFHLLLEARDMNGQGLITTTNVTIYIDDVNDNPPVFEEISDDISISYLTSRGTKIGNVTATDSDVTQQNSQITYWLIDGGYAKFDIQPETGDVIVADDLSRDPCLEMYSLSVLAVDNGFPRLSSNITVNITVSINKPPVLEPIINVTVLENENTSTNVAQINIEDPDFDINKHESIEFYLDDIDAPFELDKYSGMLRTNGPIDREMTDHMSFMVRVVNDGAPPYTASTMVTVSINDTNDNPPIFSSPTGYLVHIPEDIGNNEEDNLVELNQEFRVTDEDKTEDNRNIVIKLIGDGSEKFEFDQETGKLRILMPEDFDCETKCRYEFKVIATDQNGEGLSTSTNLTVQLLDVNDHRPIFRQQNYTFIINPSTPHGFIGGVSADDEDATNQNNQITYLHKSGGFGKFYVDPNTGEIHVVDSLIREPNLDQYQLVIIAQDNGVPRLSSTTNITIDVPVNHPPVVDIYRHDIEVPEDVPRGHRLIKITAKDKDIRQTLTYVLKEKRGPFSVNPVTGWLQVKRALDRESHQTYKLHVLVKDGGEPELTASCEIRVTVLDVNDNDPIYEGGDIYQGFVEENIKDNKKPQIVRLERNISVSDHDATFINNKVKLYLHGLGSNLFKLDSKTGQIVTAKTANIDREIHDFFHFKIAAVDSGTPARTSTATVFISVVDVNDNHPVFLSSTITFTVPEEIEPGGVIGRVMAVDKDATQPNNLLLYLLEDEPSGKFKVDINTGTISVSEGFFASPRKSIYRFNVTARDLGFPAGITSSEVTVRVPGVDYKLQSTTQEVPPTQTVMVLKEEVPNGTVIGRLDSEINHQINNIQLDPANKDPVPFTVNRDGTVVTSGRIDRETGQPFYKFKVLTVYNCTPQINTTRDVTAIVDDVNDNPPSFPLDEYTHTVSREFPKDSVVATPVAFDELDEKPSAYSYSLSGPTMECFAINKTSGVVTTTDQIQNLTAPQILSYTVTARDIHNPVLFARTRLRIHVIPNNSSNNINNSC